MDEALQQNNFIKLIAYFLAEIIRSRRTSIRRAAEISQLVMSNINSFTTEECVLSWATRIEKDFEEVSDFKQALSFNYNNWDIRVYESEIKDFASWLFAQDMARSAIFLKDAADRNTNIQLLCIKYPDFCSFLTEKTGKGELVSQLQAA